MKFFEKADKLLELDALLRAQNTGSAADLAARFGISRAQLYNHLEALRIHGFPIAYNRHKRSYYYTDPDALSVNPVVVFYKK